MPPSPSQENLNKLNKEALYAFTRTLETYRGDGVTLNNLQYDGVPLWWLYKIRFLRDAVPAPFDNFDALLKVQQWSPLQKKAHLLKRKLQGMALAHGLLVNEKLKHLYARRSTPIPSVPPSRTQILFLVHSIAMDMKNRRNGTKNVFTIDRIDPVFRAAQKESALDAQVLVIDAMSQPASLTTAGYPHFFHRYVDDTIKATARTQARRLHREWLSVKKGLCNHELFLLFEPALDFFFSELFITITIEYYETFKKIFAQCQARALVIYAPAGVLDRCAIKAADHAGIPTIALFPGMGLSSTEWTYGKNNYFLVNSPLERDQCIALGAPPEQVTAIGPITFAEIYEYQKKAEQQNRQFESRKMKGKQPPRILFCTAPMIQEGALSETDYFAAIQRFVRELAAVNNGACEVIIKPHPLEKQKYMKKYGEIIKQENLRNVRVVCGGLGKKVLYEEIAACDAFVCFFSTVLFEASVLNKPVILIELYDRHRIDESGQFYRNSEAVIKANPREPVRPIVESILFNTTLRKKLAAKRKEFNHLFCYKADAQAPARAVEYIKKKIQNPE